MTALNSDSTIQLSEVCVPTQRYEEDIVPRYKEALLSGLNGYKQYIQRNYRNTSERFLTKLGGVMDNFLTLLVQKNLCGITVVGEQRIGFGMDPLELDANVEVEGIRLGSKMVGTKSLLEADWFGIESDKDDLVGMDPTVSATLDFKVMLEAALRRPYIPYDDILTNSKIISGYENNIGIDVSASQVVTLDSLRYREFPIPSPSLVMRNLSHSCTCKHN